MQENILIKNKFQFLIGSLEAESISEITIQPMFQFLIGSLEALIG